MLKTKSFSDASHTVPSKPVWILAHESQQKLAESIVELCRKRQLEQSNSKSREQRIRSIEYKRILQWDKFADGFPNLFIHNVKEMAGKDVILICSFHSVEVIFEQVSMLYAVPRYLAHSLTVIVPYFPTGTMERIDEEGQVATAKTLASILSDTPMTCGGPTQFVIFDIHALQERFYFNRTVIPRLETAIPLIIREIVGLSEKEWKDEHIAIVFPDDGAQKRFGRYISHDWETVICSKQRQGNKRIVQIKEGNAKDKRVIIIDDLVQTGGTLIEAATLLKNEGAKSVSAYVTHGVFPKESWRKFTSADRVIETFWLTDSLPHARHIATHAPFQLLPLAPVIADVLLGFDLQDRD